MAKVPSKIVQVDAEAAAKAAQEQAEADAAAKAAQEQADAEAAAKAAQEQADADAAAKAAQEQADAEAAAKAAQEQADADAAAKAARVLFVRSVAQTGRRRAGFSFGKEATELQAEDLTDDQLEQILGDPQLSVTFG